MNKVSLIMTAFFLITHSSYGSTKLDTHFEFINKNNKTITLEKVLDSKASIFVPGYYHCKHVCGRLFTKIAEKVNKINNSELNFNIIGMSLDPNETSSQTKKFIKQVNKSTSFKDELSQHWHFLRAQTNTIKNISNRLDFNYQPHTNSNEISHSVGIYILTKKGEVSEFFSGFPPKSSKLKAALKKASQGELEKKSISDQIIATCSKYISYIGSHSETILFSLRWIGVVTIFMILFLTFRSLKNEWKER